MMLNARGTLLALLLLATAWGYAQDISLQLGFGGQIVANTWNPLQITLRDQPAAELIMTIDHGDLRVGQRIVRYEAELKGGTGLSVFSDDVYIPAWHSFTWKIRTAGAVLASGSFDRRGVDTRPLDLVVSSMPDSHRQLFASGARLAYPAASDLPARAAAYRSVRTLLIDGSTPPPSLEALAAATAAGVNTVLLEPLPSSYQELSRLAPAARQRLGAGWISRLNTTPQSLQAASPLNQQALLTALDTPELLQKPRSAPQLLIAEVAAVYLLLALLLIRFAGIPGLFAAFSLGLLLCLGAWSTLRPTSASLSETHSLSLEAGGLAEVLAMRGVFSLPEKALALPLSAHPLNVQVWTQTPQMLSLHLERWSGVTLALRPTLRTATFRWKQGQLENDGDQPLSSVYVIGLGPQGRLDPGERLAPRPDDGPTPARYAGVLPYLPAGSALAYHEQVGAEEVFIALPEADQATRSIPQ